MSSLQDLEPATDSGLRLRPQLPDRREGVGPRVGEEPSAGFLLVAAVQHGR